MTELYARRRWKIVNNQKFWKETGSMAKPGTFKKGPDPRRNDKGRPPAGLSNAEILRAAAMERLNAPLAPGSKKSVLTELTEKLTQRAIEGDANAYNALLKMLGAFNHDLKVSTDGVTVVYLDKQDEQL